MRIGASLMLIAVGAILKFAVTWTPSGIDLHVAGVILMIVGALGLAITLALLLMNRGAAPSPPPSPPSPPPPSPPPPAGGRS